MSKVSGDCGQPRHLGADSRNSCETGLTRMVSLTPLPLKNINPSVSKPQFLSCKGCSLVNIVISFFPGLSPALAQAKPQNSGFGGKVDGET